MRPNLDSLTEEIQQYLLAEHFVVFRSNSRNVSPAPIVYWDARRVPDYRQFLDCALKLGVRLVHFHTREFRSNHREEALDMLEDCEIARDDKRGLERRIEELSIYEGFTCLIELSFDFEDRIYLFEVHTEWYDEWNDIMDEIEEAVGVAEEEEPGSYGGFYSQN